MSSPEVATSDRERRATPPFAVDGATKRYGPVVALRDADVEFAAGEVHAIVGQNGSGKSTLVKILSGIVAPDEGAIRVDGRPVGFRHPGDARGAGVATVFQELSVLPSLTVAENIFVDRAPRSPLGTIRRRELNRRASELLERMQIDLAPQCSCATLSLLELQLVEIARALALAPRLLILDEATSALDWPEAQNLLRISRELAAAGGCVIFVSHRLDEIFEVADRISVLVDGAVVASGPAAETTHDVLLEQLLGSALAPLQRSAAPASRAAEPVLGVRMRGQNERDFELRLLPGEIVGLAGLQGHGQKEVLRALAGDRARHAAIEVNGRRVRWPSPRRLVERGVAYVPEDRAAEGLLLGHSVRMNMTLSALPAMSTRGVMRTAAERSACERMIERLSVRTQSQTVPVDSLSGGNQQKVLIGRVLLVSPQVVLLDDPTRGIDVGAKSDIYETLRALAAEGVAIVLNSTEIAELVGLCQRVLVFHDGEAVAELSGDELDEQAILGYMLGAR